MILQRLFRHIASAAVLLGTIFGLTACGGGGGANNCSGGQDVRTNITYPTWFDVYYVNVGATIAPLSPSAPDVPASCESSKRFSLASGTMPPGLALDTRTGVISGTPTEEGYFQFVIRLELTGFTGSVTGGILSHVQVPQAFTYQPWTERSTTLPPFEGRLDALGNLLTFTTSSASVGTVVALTSADGGLSWTENRTGSRPSALNSFASASNGSAVYVSGGQDYVGALQNNVHKFDGASWSVATASAPWSARRNHALVWKDDKLFVIGGDDRTQTLSDVWVSTDDGVHWQQTSSSFSSIPAPVVCAFALAGQLVVLTSPTPPFIGAPFLTQIWRSTDGATWTPVATSPTSPFRALLPAQPQCIVNAGRAYVFGLYDVVSTTDLVDWNFEPGPANFMSGGLGGAAIDGYLYVTNSNTQRSLYRSALVH